MKYLCCIIAFGAAITILSSIYFVCEIMFARFLNANSQAPVCDMSTWLQRKFLHLQPSSTHRLNAFSISLRDFFKIKAYKNKRIDSRAIMFFFFSYFHDFCFFRLRIVSQLEQMSFNSLK